MRKQKKPGETGTWIIRDVPRELMRRSKIASAIQGRPVKAILVELMTSYLQELERKGILPKSKE